MDTHHRPGLLEETGRNILDYIKLRLEGAKLGAVENISVLLSMIFSISVIIFLLNMAALFLFAALTWLLATALGSFVWAAVIIGGVFLAAAAIVFIKRKTLIVNPVIRSLCNMVSDITKKHPDDE